MIDGDQLDSSVNPDPWHELPASPPVRPVSSPPIPGNRPTSMHNTGWPGYGGVQGQGQGQGHGGEDESGNTGLPGLLGGLIGSLFGGGSGGGSSGSNDRDEHGHARQSEVNATGPGSPGARTGGAGGLGRTYQFNFGGGSGSVTFGTFGGGGGIGGRGGNGQIGMGPFGPFGGVPGQAVGGDQGGGLDA